ncbi:MAG: xanthine dehydrogenase accessory protein XdhC [Burkholderiaceae bacterium]
MNDWLSALARVLERDGAAVRVVVAAVRGSAPREPGACLLVTRGDACVPLGTIGGGHLEWKAIDVARGMLEAGAGPDARLDRFALGATLGQCCGGAVELWFERWDATDLALVRTALAARARGPATLVSRIAPGATNAPRRAVVAARPGAVRSAARPSGKPSPARPGVTPCRPARRAGHARSRRRPALASRVARARARRRPRRAVLHERLDSARPQLWVFGAGHVGSALVRVLGALPLDVHWVDAREAQLRAAFPDGMPANVSASISDDPAGDVASAPPGALFVVMTHSHDLDFEIVRSLLERDDFAWAGVIGSATKAARFAHRLERRGFARERIARIACPIGVPGIDGKEPATIAVAVAAQLLQVIEAGARGRVDTQRTSPDERAAAHAGPEHRSSREARQRAGSAGSPST